MQASKQDSHFMWWHCNSSWCCAVNVMFEKDSGQPKSNWLFVWSRQYLFLKISRVGLETCLNVHQTKHMAWFPEGLSWILSCLISWPRIYATCSRSTMLDSTRMPQLLHWSYRCGTWHDGCNEMWNANRGSLYSRLGFGVTQCLIRGVQRLVLRNTLGTFFQNRAGRSRNQCICSNLAFLGLQAILNLRDWLCGMPEASIGKYLACYELFLHSHSSNLFGC